MANKIRNERFEIKLTKEEKALFEEKRKLSLQDISFNLSYQEKQVLKLHIKSVLNCVKRY